MNCARDHRHLNLGRALAMVADGVAEMIDTRKFKKASIRRCRIIREFRDCERGAVSKPKFPGAGMNDLSARLGAHVAGSLRSGRDWARGFVLEVRGRGQ